MAQADGYLRIDTKLNNDELQQGLSKLKSTGAKAALAAGSAIGAALYKGMNFESAMSKVQAISGATGEALEALTEKAKEMGAKTVFSASQSAEAFQYMAMAGWKTEEMLSGIEGVMNLAAASGEELGLVSDIVTDALTAFGLKASDSAHFADVLAAASSNSNTNVAMMGETFKYVAPLAGSLGYTIEDTAQAIGLMANAGIKSSQAGTSLRAMLSRLSKPTKEVQTAMDALGISVTDSAGNIKPLNVLMQDLRKSFSTLDKAQKPTYAAMLAGQEAMSGLLAIVNASDGDFEKLANSIKNADGTAQNMADTMNDNLKGQLTILASAAEGLALSFYDGIDEPLKKAVKSGITSIDSITDAINSGELKPAIEGIGELLASIVNIIINLSTTVLPTLISALGFLGENINVILPIALTLLAVFKGYSILETITNVINKNDIALAKYIATVLASTSAGVVYTGQLTAQQITIGALTGRISILTAAKTLATKAQMALNAAWAANPVGVVIAGLTILTGIIWGVVNATQHQTEEEKALAEAQKANAEAINTRAQAYDEMKKRQGETVSSSLSELEYTKKLADELNLLTDENGRINEANQARAAFIIGQLNSALGTEIQMTDGIISNYQTLQDEIYKTIEAKRFEILMQSQEEQYAEAIKNKASAQKEVADAYANAIGPLSEIAKCENEIIELESNLADARAKGENGQPIEEAIALKKLEIEEIKEAENEVLELYNKAVGNLQDITNDIVTYETAQQIAYEKGADAAAEYIESQMSGFLDLEAATKKHGDNQQAIIGELGNTYSGSLHNLQSALENYAQTGSDGARQAVLNALQDVQTAQTEYEAAGGKIVDGIITGLNGKEIDINPLLNGITQQETAIQQAGYDFSAGIATGIRNGQNEAIQAAIEVMQAAIAAAKEAEDSHSPAKIPAKEVGEPFSQGVAIGIENESDKVEGAATNVVEAAIDTAKQGARLSSSAGEMFVDGVAIAIVDEGYKVSDAVRKMFENLDLKRAVGAISEGQYYAEMECIRDEYIKEGTKDWWNYTKQIINYEKQIAEESAKKAEETRKKRVDALSDNFEKEIDSMEHAHDIRVKLGQSSEQDELDLLRRQSKKYFEFLDTIQNANYLNAEERQELIEEYTEKAQDALADSIEKERQMKKVALEESIKSEISEIEHSYNLRSRLGIATSEEEAEMLRRRGNTYLEFLEKIKNADYLSAEEREELLKEHTQNAEDAFIDSYNIIADKAKEKFEEINSKQLAFADKLKEHASFTQTFTFENANEGDETFALLTDWSKKAEEIDEYNKLLDSVLARGGNEEVNSMLLEMGIEEGSEFAKLLLGASDEEFDEYMRGYKEYQDKAEEIATEKYKAEADAAVNSYKDAINNGTKEMINELREIFGDVPDDFLAFGDESGENFEAEFMKHFELIASNMRIALDTILSDFKFSIDDADTNGSITNNTEYNFYGSNGTVAENLWMARNYETLNRFRGI